MSTDTFIISGRRIISHTANEYGYKGTEVAACLAIEPASVPCAGARKVGDQGCKRSGQILRNVQNLIS